MKRPCTTMSWLPAEPIVEMFLRSSWIECVPYCNNAITSSSLSYVPPRSPLGAVSVSVSVFMC